MTRYFSFTDDKSDKFWQIDTHDTSFTVTFGKRGTTGQSQVKTFDTADRCQREADKLIREKTAKGYVESGDSQPITSQPRVATLRPASADKEAEIATLTRYDELIQQAPMAALLPFLQRVDTRHYEALRKKIKEARRYWCDYVVLKTIPTGVNKETVRQEWGHRGSWPQRIMISLSGVALLSMSELKPFDGVARLLIGADKEFRELARQLLEWAKPDWLGDFLLQQAGESWTTIGYHKLREFEAAGLVSYNPELFARSATTFSNWNSENTNRNERTYRYHIESLARDEQLVTRELPAIFDYPTEIHTYTYAFQGAKKEWVYHPVWPLVFEQWLTEGKIDRLWFLERCLSVQTKDWNINLRTFFRKQFETANPTTAELLALQPALLPLLAAQHPHVVNWSIGLIKTSSNDPDFQTDEFLEWVAAVMMRADCKTGLKTLLSLLERTAKTGPQYRPTICIRLADVFAVNDLPLQTKAAQLLTIYGDPSDPDLQSALQTYAGQMLGNVSIDLQTFLTKTDTTFADAADSSATYQYVPGKPVERLVMDQAVTLPDTWNDFLFLIGQFIGSNDPLDCEILMNALILPPANMPADFQEQLKVYHKKLTKTYFQSQVKQQTSMFLLHWLHGGMGQFTLSAHTTVQTLDLQFNRLQHVRQKWKAGSTLPLLSFPTHAPHWIAPKTLVERLLAYQQAGEAIVPLDLAIAIARMPREETAEAITLCNELTPPLASLMRYSLGASPERDVPHKTALDKLRALFQPKTNLSDQQILWAVAARTVEPEAEFSDFDQTHFADLPNVAKPFTQTIQITERWHEWRNYQTKQMERSPSWRELTITFPKLPDTLRPVLLYSNDLSERQNSSWAYHSLDSVDVAYWNSLLPQQPESLFTVVAKYGSLSSETSPAVAPALACMLQPGFRIRTMSMLVLATGLLAKKRETGTLAAEVLIHHFGEQTLDAVQLGDRLGWLLADNYAPLQRLADALNLVRDVSPLHNQALLLLLDALFARLAEAAELPKNTKKLLELYIDLLVKRQATPPAETVTTLKMWQQIASLKTTCAAILQKA
ncbi:WGR domain-containing protein [Spirosoma sp. BT702]|uniref:WGR domain-containing protein n=1 Tax=Spirosoma profusum TaxID=2771354 RepID=A0A927AWG9_9BACT|nr:DUF6493 family protein [Spirosoma profusum]MBD2705641.1 WGR domain-containing protein [Spirosoma profusum]